MVVQSLVRNRIVFDPSNKEHRKAYCNFKQNGTWNGMNIFILEREYATIPDMIKDKMVTYYMEKEFNK